MESKKEDGKIIKKDNRDQHFNGPVRAKIVRLTNPQQQGSRIKGKVPRMVIS